MKAAYADPPYLGCGHLYPEKTEVYHCELLGRLMEFDAWALSASSPSLHIILPMCPDDTRIGAWVKPFASFKPNVRVAYAWEPVLFRGARKGSRDEPTVRDWTSQVITLKSGMVGAKPEGFCFWLFELLGLKPGDELVDLFPGTGAVGHAWQAWCTQLRFDLSTPKIETTQGELAS